MNKPLAVCLLTWLSNVAPASAGVPAWCKDIDPSNSYSLDALAKEKDPGRAVQLLVNATCLPNAEASAAMAQITAARQAWGKKMVMDEADWADAVAYANDGGRPKDLQLTGAKDFATLSPLDQYVVITQGWVKDYGPSFTEAAYTADVLEPYLTEVGRFGYLRECVTGNTKMIAEHAQCQGDLDAFDRAKFAVHLRSDTTHPAANKMQLRLELYALTEQLKRRDEEIKATFAKDAAYKQLFTAAAKGRAQFAVTAAANKDLLALAAKLDSAYWSKSRKLFDGCQAATQAMLEKIIASKLPASTFANIKKDVAPPKYDDDDSKRGPSFGAVVAPMLADIPELGLLTGPYSECRDPQDAVARFLQGLHRYTPGLRGPRRAALIAMLNEKIVLDDMDERVGYPSSREPYTPPGNVHEIGTGGGIVFSSKLEGDYVIVSFAKQTGKTEECIASHTTNKVHRVNSDGTLTYEWVCDKYGMVDFDNTPRDSRVLKVYAPLIKKGVQFSASGDVLVAVWPSKDAKLPSHVLGVEVK